MLLIWYRSASCSCYFIFGLLLVFKLEFIIKKGIELVFEHGPRLLGAIIILLIGLYFSKLLEKLAGKMMHKSKVEDSLLHFVKGLIGALLKTLVIITFLGMVGVEVTSFVAILGAVGLAVGMALSGTLQNFAGGVIILLFKPFKVGDLIEGHGHLGRVKEIRIFVTVLLTPENKTVIIPNGPLSNNDIVNYAALGSCFRLYLRNIYVHTHRKGSNEYFSKRRLKLFFYEGVCQIYKSCAKNF